MILLYQLRKKSKTNGRIFNIITRNYSDSASGESKGTLLVSANMEIKKEEMKE